MPALDAPQERQPEPTRPNGPDDRGPASAGDAHAFGRLYLQHAPRVLRHILSRVKNPALAEDLTAQTFTNAWQALGHSGQRPPRSLPAWLLTIANNLIVSNYRRTRREVQAGENLERLAGDHDPEREALGRALSQELQRALGCLTPEQRFILSRRIIDDMRYSELAAILGKRQGAVRVAVSRALAALRQALASDVSFERR